MTIFARKALEDRLFDLLAQRQRIFEDIAFVKRLQQSERWRQARAIGKVSARNCEARGHSARLTKDADRGQ